MENKKNKFVGRVERKVFNSEDFKVYAMDVDTKKYTNIHKNKYGNVSILGELSDLSMGVDYDIEAIEENGRYGLSYKVLNIRREEPTSQDDIFIFLSEILTTNQANVLYENYPNIIQIIKNGDADKVDLNKLNGIKEKTFEKIKSKIIENFCLVDLVTEFKGYLSLSIIKKIYNKYTSIDMLREKLKKDPYKCLCGVSGIGFKTADAILLEIENVSNVNISNGEKPIINFEGDLRTSKQRCLACVLYLLDENESNGHTKMNLANLRTECMKVVPECIDMFTDAIKSKDIYYNKDNMNISLKSTYETECYIADTIIKNLVNDNVWEFDTSKYNTVNGCELSEEQSCVLDLICKYNVCILNGAGGTGKTFSTQAVINMLDNHNKSYKLLSPTGKASKVLSECTNRSASTIHRGLGYTSDGWTFNSDNKLATDVVIIDEFSMVDVHLFKRVIDAIDFTNTKLLMIGDNAQLTSVGCGNLLHDFMQTKLIPTSTLTKVFRYGEGGLMKIATDTRMCRQYLNNDMKRKATTFGDNKDYTFIDLPSELMTKNVVALYRKLINSGYTIEDIQVLTAKNVGDCGTVALNNVIQKVANKNYGSPVHMDYGKGDSAVTYYEGDLIIQVVNNYKAEIDTNTLTQEEMDYWFEKDEAPTAFVANGESGIIKEIFKTYMLIDFDGVIIKYYKADLKMIKLGYSISVHKSQGSSIKVVILCTPQSHTFMLNSNLIYVGLTRMKERCFHLGSLSTVNSAVKKKANLERNTNMQELLISMNKNK